MVINLFHLVVVFSIWKPQEICTRYCYLGILERSYSRGYSGGVCPSREDPIGSCSVTSAFWSTSFTLWLPTLMVNKRAVSTRWRLPPSISRLPPKEYIFRNLLLKSKETSFPNISGKCFCKYLMDVPGGAVVRNPPANAGDKGSSPGPRRSHMPRSN